jgi:hypothetical protein
MSIVFDINDWTNADVHLSVAIPDPVTSPDGVVNIDVIGAFFVNNGRWAVYNQGSNILATVAITEGTSLIRLAYLTPPTGDTWVVIPSFAPELMSLSGIPNAGGLIHHSYP